MNVFRHTALMKAAMQLEDPFICSKADKRRTSFSDSMFASCGPGSVVGIANAYGLDCPGIESVRLEQS